LAVLLQSLTNYSDLKFGLVCKNERTRNIAHKFGKHCWEIRLSFDVFWTNFVQKNIVVVKPNLFRADQSVLFSDDCGIFNPRQTNRASTYALPISRFEIDRKRLHLTTPHGKAKHYNLE